MTNPTVSVALCTRNGAAFVEEQLRSILDQTRPPDEVVISDDDSADDTLDLVRREVSRRSGSTTVTILSNETALGVTANFEQAIRATHGQLVALSDQDDVWHPDRLARLIGSLDSAPATLLLFSDARLVDSRNTDSGQTLFGTLPFSSDQRDRIRNGNAFSVLMQRNVVTGATTVFRRELADRAYPFPASWLHDEWLAVVAAATGGIDFLDECLTDYRQHESNQVGVLALDAGGAIGRLREHRTARNSRLLARAQALNQRIAGFEPRVSDAMVRLAGAKVEHETVRSALPAQRLLRLPQVVREWGTGRYREFGNGFADVARDLVQPV